MPIKSQTDEILIEVKEGIATVTLNRPDKLNALSQRMIDTLDDICHGVSEDDDIKVMVLTGTGRGFCSGVDFTGSYDSFMSLVKTGRKAEMPRKWWTSPKGWQMLSLYNCTKPTIAAINGITGGLAAGFIACCDIRIASEASRFGLFFGGIGISLDYGVSWFLPRLIGLDKALELYYTNRIIDAEEALRIGLVTRVVPHDDLMKASNDLALNIAKGPNIGFELGRREMREGLYTTLETHLNFETVGMNLSELTEDAEEAKQAFLEKRPPKFKGR